VTREGSERSRPGRRQGQAVENGGGSIQGVRPGFVSIGESTEAYRDGKEDPPSTTHGESSAESVGDDLSSGNLNERRREKQGSA
jgi:hypothetical protein